MSDEKFPTDKFKRMTFTFTKEEQHQLTQLQGTVLTAKLMEQTAEKLTSTIINTVCLKRVNVSAGPEVNVEYDLATGVFYVFVPRKQEEAAVAPVAPKEEVKK